MVVEISNRVKPSRPQYDIISSTKQVNLFLAGQGSGKTQCAGVISARMIQRFPKCHGFIGANTYTQLSDSTMFRIRTVWKQVYNWTEYSKENPGGNFVVNMQPPAHFNTEGHEYDSYRGKICFVGGTVIYTGSLENYKAHDGKEFAWALLDETKDTKEEAVKEVITGRLREPGIYLDMRPGIKDDDRHTIDPVGNQPYNPLYIFTSPAKVEWINQWFELDEYAKEITEVIYSPDTYFIKDSGNKRVVISSTYHNAPNLPSNYIDNQKSNLHSKLQDMLIYGNPFSNTGGEFYKCFLRTKHVLDVRTLDQAIFNGERAYNKDIPLHISFDFNVNPYITCTIWQIIGGKKIIEIDEICLANPINTTADVCKEFIRRYQGHQAGLFIYGDPSGRQQDTRSEKGFNDFTLIMRALNQFKPNLRIAAAAPPVVMRGNFINTILEKGFEGLEIFIHDKNVKSINDFIYLKEASDGTKLKEKTKDTNTGVSYEKYGHCFVGETMIATATGQKRIDEIQIGDIVLTRFGYRPVIRVWENGMKDVRTYKIGETEITCTPAHKFWTNEYGFKEIKYLILPITLCILASCGKRWNKKKLSITMGSILPDTQTQKQKVYDLMVGEHHEYFANGVLVSNCSDSADYFICSAFAGEFARYMKGGVSGAAASTGKRPDSRNAY